MRDIVTEMSFGFSRDRLHRGFAVGFEADHQLEQDRQYQRAPDRFAVFAGPLSELVLARKARQRHLRRRRELLYLARISEGEDQRRHVVPAVPIEPRSIVVIEPPVRTDFGQAVQKLLEAFGKADEYPDGPDTVWGEA